MRRWLFFLFFIMLLTSTAKAAEMPRSIEELRFNDGETVYVRLRPATSPTIQILSGKAHRVPDGPRRAPLFELDISSRFFSARVSETPLITFSGPRRGSISGIHGERWGTLERPAIYIDRDIDLTLSGKVGSLTVIVSPFARARIHTGKLRSSEIIIINNPRVSVTGPGKKQVKFIAQKQEAQAVTSSEWESGTDKAPPPPVPDAPAPPAPPAPAISRRLAIQ